MQVIALGTLLIPWEHFFALSVSNQWWVVMMLRLGQALAGVALALTLFSGVMYVLDGVRLMRAVSAADERASVAGETPRETAPKERSLAGQHVRN